MSLVVAIVAVVLSVVALVVARDRSVRCQCHLEEPLASLTALASVTAGVRARSARHDGPAARATARHGRHVQRVHRRPHSRPVG